MHVIRATAIGCVVAGTLLTGVPAAAATPSDAAPPAVAERASEGSAGRTACGPVRPPRGQEWLDGFRIRWLPPGLGPLVSDVEYEWDDVGFRSRVWESGPDADGAYSVDLQVTVMRGAVLTDAAAMRTFLVEYHERDPHMWAREPFEHPDGPGFRADGELFWLAEPGVAVRVHADGERFSARDLVRAACGVEERSHQARAGDESSGVQHPHAVAEPRSS